MRPDRRTAELSGRIQTFASAPVELYGAVNAVGKYVLTGQARSAWIRQVATERPEIIASLTAAYFEASDERARRQTRSATWEAAEILVYAVRSGCLRELDVAGLLAAAPALAADGVSGGFVMATEDPAIEAMVRDRLEALARDPSRLQATIGAWRALWEFLAPAWEESGRAAAGAEVDRIVGELGAAASLRTLIPPLHAQLRERFAVLLSGGIESVALVPLAFAGTLGWIVSVPGLTCAGYGLGGPDGAVAEHRARATQAAEAIRLLGEPTRATIMRLLHEEPFSVSDLATLLGLTQPTVSVHVKLLREAGLLEAQRAGKATLYRAREGAVASLLGEVRAGLLS